jgi:CubicO group peptidase (beta-lactamase class C family)
LIQYLLTHSSQQLEKASGLKLGEWLKKHIFDVLGMTTTSFRPEELAQVSPVLADTAVRAADGGLTHHAGDIFGEKPQYESGGGGLYSTADDYIKVLISLTKNDGKLLKSESIDELFKPQLQDPSHLQAVVDNRGVQTEGNFPRGTLVSYGLGGMLNLTPVPGRRAKGSMQWGGLPNLTWVSWFSFLPF